MAKEQNDPIKHVVVLMLENRSFDQMLGVLKIVYGNKLDGVDRNHLHLNRVHWNEVYQQSETRTSCVSPAPRSDLENVLRQIDKSAEYPRQVKTRLLHRVWNWAKIRSQCLFCYRSPTKVMKALNRSGRYEGAFVEDYARAYPESTALQRQEIMGYYPFDCLPALHALAREFMICDRWFASVPGPSWANRFFVHAGTALGKVSMPEFRGSAVALRTYDQDTVYDRLNERNRTWKIYFGDIPQSLMLTHQMNRENIENYRPMNCFYDDAARPASQFPEYSFIEPRYFLSNANDNCPSHSTMHAQCLIADVYNALRRNEELWRKTLLIIVYSQHGGFFDHVEPPATTCPDALTDEYTFDRLGVRVPALLVSCWLKKSVRSTVFDHTSVIRYLTEKWGLGPLGNRVARANSISDAFRGVVELRTDTLPQIRDSPEMDAARAESGRPDRVLNDHQLALLAFGQCLSALLEPSQRSAVEQRPLLGDRSIEIEDAKDIVHRFLEQAQPKFNTNR